MRKDAVLSENMEDYLEVILELEQTAKVARAKDIAEKLNIQRGSVTGALKTLEGKGLINYEPYSFVTLTAKGTKIAKEIARRHVALKDFLLRVLQVDAETAEATACRLEHGIDAVTMDRLVEFIGCIHKCPRIGAHWLRAFSERCCTDESDRERCGRCIDDCRERYQNGAA